MKNFVLKSFVSFLVLVAGSTTYLQAASLSLSGDYRIGSTMLVNPDLTSGTASGKNNTTNFLEHRFLLRPDVVIDERFSVKSELNFLQYLGSANNVGPYFGSGLGSTYSQVAGDQALIVSQAYLRWASDWGLTRFGRINKSWGLGVLYDGSADPLDDFQTIRDRADFQAMLGNLGVRFAFEKGAEGSLTNDGDDIDTYELAIDYANAEDSSAVGIMYSRNVRSDKSTADGGSSHDLSLFARKRWNNIQLAGEFVSITSEGIDARTGALAQVDYFSNSWRFGYDFAFASASNNSTFSFNPNYRPFMLLFRHSLGLSVPAAELRAGRGVGSDVVNDGGGGALVNKLHASYNFASSGLVLGSNFGFASLQRAGATTGSKNLGFETDLFLTQKWYDNFEVHYAGGLLFPGQAFAASPTTSWAVELKGVLKF